MLEPSGLHFLNFCSMNCAFDGDFEAFFWDEPPAEVLAAGRQKSPMVVDFVVIALAVGCPLLMFIPELVMVLVRKMCRVVGRQP